MQIEVERNNHSNKLEVQALSIIALNLADTVLYHIQTISETSQLQRSDIGSLIFTTITKKCAKSGVSSACGSFEDCNSCYLLFVLLLILLYLDMSGKLITFTLNYRCKAKWQQLKRMDACKHGLLSRKRADWKKTTQKLSI